ncbi:MAG: D-alanyl-D-alanine carboxypeptidase family protein [Clostridia bacterium]
MTNSIKKIIFLVGICIFTTSIVLGSSYIYSLDLKTNVSSMQTVAPPTFAFKSAAQILVEPTTGKVIYENNADEKLLPASVTKIMTLLLTMEAIDSGKLAYTDKITCSANASKMGGSQIWFKENEQLSVEECLKAICVVSANDVSMAVAEHIGGSSENFVAMMNNRAKELSMNNTHFMNPHGIDEAEHYTSARDISIMSSELISKHPNILKFTSIWMDTLRGGTFGLTNTNKLIRFYPGANGLKTGSTSQALFNLSGSATKNGLSLIAVVLKAPTAEIRNEEVKQLLDYGFNNYACIKLAKKDEVIGDVKIEKANIEKVHLKFAEDINNIMDKGQKAEIVKEVKIDKKLLAPVKATKQIGEVIFKNGENVVYVQKVYIGENIPKISLSQMYKKMLKNYYIFSK